MLLGLQKFLHIPCSIVKCTNSKHHTGVAFNVRMFIADSVKIDQLV